MTLVGKESMPQKTNNEKFMPNEDPGSFVRGGPTLTLFLTDKRIQIALLKSGSSLANQQNAIKQWCFAGGQMMAQH